MAADIAYHLGTLIVTDDMRSSIRLLSGVPEPAFAQFSVALFGVLCGSSVGKADMNSLIAHSALVKLGVAAAAAVDVMTAFAIDFARCNSQPPTVRSKLEESGLSGSKSAAFSEAYSSRIVELQQVLGAMGHKLPELIDVSWALDYVVSSKETGKIGRPLYRVRLTLRDYALSPWPAHTDQVGTGTGAFNRTAEFSCTAQELEDVQSRLKEAQRSATLLLSPLGASNGRPGGKQ